LPTPWKYLFFPCALILSELPLSNKCLTPLLFQPQQKNFHPGKDLLLCPQTPNHYASPLSSTHIFLLLVRRAICHLAFFLPTPVSGSLFLESVPEVKVEGYSCAAHVSLPQFFCLLGCSLNFSCLPAHVFLLSPGVGIERVARPWGRNSFMRPSASLILPPPMTSFFAGRCMSSFTLGFPAVGLSGHLFLLLCGFHAFPNLLFLLLAKSSAPP